MTTKGLLGALIILLSAFVTGADPIANVTGEMIKKREDDCRLLSMQYMYVMKKTGIGSRDMVQILDQISDEADALSKGGAFMTASGFMVSMLQKGGKIQLNLLSKSGLAIGIPASILVGLNEVSKTTLRGQALQTVKQDFAFESEEDQRMTIEFLGQRLEACQENLRTLKRHQTE